MDITEFNINLDLAKEAAKESAGGIADISSIRENFQVNVIFSNSHIND